MSFFQNAGNFIKNAWYGPQSKQVGTAQNFSKPQLQAFNQFIQQYQNPQNAGSYDIFQNPIYQQALGSTSRYLQPFDPQQYNQYFEQGVANPALREYEQKILPLIRQGGADQSNLYGSYLDQALSQSAQELGQGLGSLRAQYLQNAQEQHATREQTAIAQALGLAQQPVSNYQSALSQIFGARPQEAIVQQGPGHGWLQDIARIIAKAAAASAGGAAAGGGGF